MYNLYFYGIWRRFIAILASFSFSVFLAIMITIDFSSRKYSKNLTTAFRFGQISWIQNAEFLTVNCVPRASSTPYESAIANKFPPLGSRGRVGDFTLPHGPGQKTSMSYPLRLEFRSNAPTPEARKMKISKVSKKTAFRWNPALTRDFPELWSTTAVLQWAAPSVLLWVLVAANLLWYYAEVPGLLAPDSFSNFIIDFFSSSDRPSQPKIRKHIRQ